MQPTTCTVDWTLRGLTLKDDAAPAGSSGPRIGHARPGAAGLPDAPPCRPGLLERPPAERPALLDDGRIDGAALAAHVEALMERVQHLRPGWGTGHAALVKALQGIAASALDAALPEHQRGLAVRHGWAAAARAARGVAREIDLEARLRHAPDADVPRARAYEALGALFVELKRRHLAAVAPQLAAHHAEREARALAAAGLRSGRSGDVLNSAQGVSASWSTGAWTLGGGTRANEMLLIDDDTGSYYAESQQHHLRGAWGLEAGVLQAQPAGVRWQRHLGRELLSAPDTPSLAKMVLNLRANRSRVDTAGPLARRALDAADSVKRWLARAAGKGWVPVPGAPTYLHDAKLVKGLDGTKARLACAQFDAAWPGTSALADWLALAYPAVEEQARVRLLSAPARDEQGGPAPVLPPDWLQATAPVSGAYRGRALGVRLHALGLEARLGVAAPGGDSAPGRILGVAAKAAATQLQFFLRLPKASHELLMDTGSALDLHRALHALPPHAQSQLRPYHQVGEQLAGPDAPPSEADALAHGLALADVPAVLRPALVAPDAALLARARRLGERLAEEHLVFVRLAKAFTSAPDRFMTAAGRHALQQERRAAFEAIQQHVWGGAYPGGWQAAQADPQAFVALSHDAMSLALGALSTQLGLLADRVARDDAHRELAQPLADAQAALARTRALYDLAYLPMSRRTLTAAGATLHAEGLFQRHDAGVSFSVGAGLDGLASALTGGAVSVDSQAWQAGFSVDLRYQVADVQINEGRLGEYLQLTLGVRGGAPLAGAVVERALREGLQRLFPGTTAEAAARDAADLARQLHGLALDVAEGGALVLKWHRAPGGSGFALQYARGQHTREAGLGLAVPVPTPGGLVNLGVQAGTSAQSTMLEAAGPDPTYHALLWPALQALLEGEGAPGEPTLQERFERDPLMKSRYFARPNTLIEVLEALPERPEGASDEALARARETLDTLHGADERLAFHAGEGRALFDAYVQAIGARVAAVKARAFHLGPATHGFELRLRDAAHRPPA